MVYGDDARDDRRDFRRDSDYSRRQYDHRGASEHRVDDRGGPRDGYSLSNDGYRGGAGPGPGGDHSRGDRGRFEAPRHDQWRWSEERCRSRSRSRSPRRAEESNDRWRRDQDSHRQVQPASDRSTPPSATLIVRGLSPHVSEAMIYQALGSFHPTSVRVMLHKITREPRGFGFINFASVDAAVEVMGAFAHQPLRLDTHPVTLNYADSNRPSPHVPHQGQSAAPCLDWICDQCGSSNFARRTECFKCHVPKSQFAMEVPAQMPTPAHGNIGGSQSQLEGHVGRDPHGGRESVEPPSNILVVRMIPFDVGEAELHGFFSQCEGLQDIRLVRDRETNQSRGFAFIEYADINAAQNAKDEIANQLLRGAQIWIGFARESYRSKPVNRSVPMNPIAAAALEQAQWSLGNGYGAAYQSQQQDQQEDEAAQTSVGLDDLDALLGSAAAAARPHIEQPKKPWPLPFEKAGGMFTFASQFGLYYDADSMFYYDPHSKLYYNSFTGVYYRCSDGEHFEVFSPPPPSDDAVFNADHAATHPVPTQMSSSTTKPIAMSLTKKKDKKPLIAFSLTTRSAVPPVTGFEAPTPVPAAPQVPVGTGVPVASAASASVRKKSALDIAKWSLRQQHQGEAPAETAKTPVAAPTAPSVAAAVEGPLEAPICLLCRRKFASLEQQRKHEAVSKLHAENLAKANQDKEIVAAQVRERDEEERKQQQRSLKRPRSEPAAVPPLAPVATEFEPAASSLESGVGAKMLKMMGWKQGEGLGKHGTGITAPVQATGNVGSETIGLGARSAPVIDLSDVASYKERLQRMARARYDGADTPTNTQL